MSIQTVLNTGVYSALSSGTALTTLLGGTAIYFLQAPDMAALPYVVFSSQGGGPENITDSDMRDVSYFVRAYADDADEAGALDSAIHALLDRAVLTVSGYTNIWTRRTQDITLVDNLPDGSRVYTSGGLYRIRLDS